MRHVELKVTAKTENPLMKRTEILAEMFFGGATPSRKDVMAALAKQLHTAEDFLVIGSIETFYKTRSAKITARLYKDKETLKAVELEHLTKRGRKEEKAEAAEEKEKK